MRLPQASEIRSNGAWHLYRHDLLEWHNPNWLYRLDYRYRLHRVIELVKRYAPGRQCLEVGCAQANTSLLLAEQGYKATVLDLDSEFIGYARLKHTHGEVRFLVANGENLPFSNASFHVVLLTELLEHVAYPEDFLQEVHRVLFPNGIIVLTTPNGAHHQSELPTFEQVRLDRTPIVTKQFGPDAGDHLFLFKMRELQTVVKYAGYQVVHAEEFFVDVVRRIRGKLWSYKIWQGVGSILTRPLAVIFLQLDAILRRLHLVDSERSAMGLLLVAVKENEPSS